MVKGMDEPARRAGFDRPDAESPFLTFVAREFHRRGTPRRFELSKKEHSHPFVEGMGMRVPRPLGNLDAIGDLKRIELPERFVLKFARGWSARGVMLLERLDATRFFDHLSLRIRTLDDVVAAQDRVAASFGAADPRWLLEEMVPSTLAVGAVPFDYKFYCFNGVIGMIGQFDRNANPPKMALFDGGFRPLRHGVDYIRGSKRIQRGIHLLPLHAPEMMWWAQTLSTVADAPFVSIDMYDSPDGPVFGEFTYSPGGTYRRMFVFSHAILDRFDALFRGEAGGEALASSGLGCRRDVPSPEAALYRALAGYAYNGGARGAERLSALYADAGRRHPTEQVGTWARHLAEGWDRVRLSLAEQVEHQARQAALQLEQR